MVGWTPHFVGVKPQVLGGPLGGAVGLSSFGRLYCTSHEIEIEFQFEFRVRQRNRKSKSKIRCRIANHESIESTEIDKLVTNLRTSIFDWLSNRQSKSGLTIENANRKYDWHVDRMSDRQSWINRIDGDRHPVSSISLLVRGTRIGNYNLRLIAGTFTCESLNSRFRNVQTYIQTDQQDLVWGISISGISLSRAHSQFLY